MEKIERYYEISDVGYTLDGDSIEEAIDHLNELKERFGKNYTDLTLEKNDEGELHLCGYKLETDEQFNRRVSETEAKERVEYERLKKKYK
jgi:hypothetical protein